jgi:hypothetical protein
LNFQEEEDQEEVIMANNEIPKEDTQLDTWLENRDDRHRYQKPRQRERNKTTQIDNNIHEPAFYK